MAKSRQLAALIKEMRETYAEYLHGLSPHERQSLQGHMDAGLNPLDIATIGKVIRNAPRTPRDLVTYRGARPGAKLLDRRSWWMTPTSLDPEYAAHFGNPVEELEVPRGSPGIFLDPITKRDQREHELLLPGHDTTSRFEATPASRRFKYRPPYKKRGGLVKGTL